MRVSRTVHLQVDANTTLCRMELASMSREPRAVTCGQCRRLLQLAVMSWGNPSIHPQAAGEKIDA